MLTAVSISKEHRASFEKMLNSILPLAYQVDVVCRHEKLKSVYYIPSDDSRIIRTLRNIERTLN